MRFAYADPPYLGLAVKFYGKLHPEAAVYDTVEAHRDLLARLDADYDGWAYSLQGPALQTILPHAPAGTRIGVWLKPFASFKPGVNPAYTWEPVLFKGCRKYERTEQTVRDWHIENIALKKGLGGAKPVGFALWLLDLWNAHPDDELADPVPRHRRHSPRLAALARGIRVSANHVAAIHGGRTMKFVYVASPYTKGDVAVNVRNNLDAADKLARAGFIPFAPLLTHFWHLLFPHPYEFWCDQDNAWVAKCDCMVRLPGDSSGADKEVALAESLGIPVFIAADSFSIGEFNLWSANLTALRQRGR